MSLISIAMVSHLGDAAVAGIGIASALFSTLMAVLFAHRYRRPGAGGAADRRGHVRLAGTVLNDALAIAVGAGLLLTLLGYVAGPAVFRLVTTDANVMVHGLPYLNAALPMLLFLGASFAFSAYRNGAGTPRYSLVVALIQLAGSTLFSYLLIFGAQLGTAGAGFGATLAALAALAVHLILAKWIAPVPGFLAMRPSRSGIWLILKIGLPVGLQQSLVYVGTAVYLAIVGLLGIGEVAAMNVVLNMMLLAILPAAGIGIAAATLVGTALGRGDVVDAKRWGWEVSTLGAFGILAFSLIVVAAPQSVLGLFIADRATIELAATPLRVMALGMGVDAFGRILGFALRGAGATRLVTLVAFGLQWGVQLPLTWLVGVHLGFGLVGMAVCRLLLFAAEALIVATLWRNGLWIGGAINHSGCVIISTARQRP